MRHGDKVAKLGRRTPHRKAMLGNLVASLLENEVVRTTDVRAKEVRRVAEHIISFGKRQDLHSRRQVLRVVPNKRVVAKVFSELADRYRGRSGGYTRVVKLGPRRGDGAEMSLIELVDRQSSGSGSGSAKSKAPASAEKAEE